MVRLFVLLVHLVRLPEGVNAFADVGHAFSELRLPRTNVVEPFHSLLNRGGVDLGTLHRLMQFGSGTLLLVQTFVHPIGGDGEPFFESGRRSVRQYVCNVWMVRCRALRRTVVNNACHADCNDHKRERMCPRVCRRTGQDDDNHTESEDEQRTETADELLRDWRMCRPHHE